MEMVISKVMQELKQFIEQMRATSSSNEKVEILKQQSDFIKKVLEYTYNPYKQYNVTSKTIKKNPDLHKTGYVDLFYLLDALNKRTITGHDAIAYINAFTESLSDSDTELIYSIIDKDLKTRTGAKVINKALPGLIPEFNVALAQEYNGKCNWDDHWYVSRKLDGVRCLAVVDEEGKCTLYSRMGKEFTTLNKIKEAIEATNIINTVFDGEICLLDKEGNEDFQGVMKQLRRKDHQIENPMFMMFDMLHKSEFEQTEHQQNILSERLRKLRSFMNNNGYYDPDLCDLTRPYLRYLDQYRISDNDHFISWSEMPKQEGWEGLMLRKDVAYEGKRTKNLLKVKMFHDAEYEVIDFDIDDHEVVREGKSETIKMLAQVWIEHKGHRVKVGSGWTQDQRLQYMDGSIVGKIITVQYFEETKNDKGGISLRFPTVKVVHGEKREL
jgi:DNA ligase-1